MRNLFIVIALTLYTATAHSEVLIGFVNMEQATASLQRTKDVEKEYKEDMQRFRANIDSAYRDLVIQDQELENSTSSMSATAFQSKKEELHLALENLKAKAASGKKLAREVREEKRMFIRRDLLLVVNQVSQKSNLDLVIDATEETVLHITIQTHNLCLG